MKRQWHRTFFFALFILLWILFEIPQILFFQPQVEEAQAAQIKSVQRGSQAMTVTPTTVPISSVVTTNSFVICDFRPSSAGQSTKWPTCELSGATSLVITTGAADAATVVNWQVVEFTPGVSVQRNLRSFASGDTTINVPITAVDTTKTFVLVTSRNTTVSNSTDQRTTVRARLTSTTNLELSRNFSGEAIDVAWQVVQMDGASVQSDLTTINAGSTTATATMSSVDTTKTFLVFNTRGAGAVNGIEGQYLVRGTVTDSTTLTFTRNSTLNSVDISWFAVTMNDGSTVQKGSLTDTTTETTRNVTISPINTTTSMSIVSSDGGTDVLASALDDSSWTSTFTSSTNLQFQRASALDVDTDIEWFVVQFAATPLFRSVGTNGANLNTGGRTVTISGTTATFSGSMPDNIGVGDALTYNSGGNRLAFIHGRTSSTVFTVKDKNGGTPTAASALAVGVYRAYTSLANWQSQTENGNILEPVENDVNPSKDLVSAGTLLNVACYGDGADTTAVSIDGWTTGANNYINIFTPYLSSEVGVTQRHSGKWDTGKYQLVANEIWIGVIDIRDEYVKVTGLQIENNGTKTSGNIMGINNRPGLAASEVSLSHNILRATGTGTGVWQDAAIYQYNSGGVLRAWNNTMYDWGGGISSEWITGGSVVLYNNTVVNSEDTGILLQGVAAGNYRVANNLVQGSNPTDYVFTSLNGGLDYSATNLSSDATSPQVELRNKTVSFVGAVDYHLASTDTSAKDQGTNLSSDPNLAFSDDIDGHSRPSVPTWDIGADEYVLGTFEYRRQLTLNCSGRGASCGSSLSDFPVLIDTTNWPLADKNTLKTVSNGGKVYRPEGYDIIFRASNGVTQLDHEIEKYDGSTGTLVAWVKIPTLFDQCPTTGTVIYMYHGNSAISSPTANKTGVWSNNFREVWHLHETGGGTVADSTSSGYTGTAAGNATQGVAGKIATAVAFDGSAGSRVTLADGSMASNQIFTFSAWVWADTLNSQWEGIVTKGRDSDIDWQGLWINGSNVLSFGWELPAGNVDGSALSAGQWYYVAATYDGTNRRLYLNNALNGGPSLGSHSSSIAENTLVGEDPRGSVLDGVIDEVRISTVARDLCWIQTEYNNQSNPGTFITLGLEEPSFVISGYYQGNGLDNRPITGLGFQPDIVIIKANDTQDPVCSTSSMPGNNAKTLGSTAAALVTNLIKSLDADGFTIGIDARVNTNGIGYYWVAFKAGAGESKVSSYPGTGVTHSITGVGFQPDWVVVMSSAANISRHRTASMTNTAYFHNIENDSTGIIALEPDGFRVDTDATVNTNGTTYHYFAFKKVSGKMNEGSYIGNAPTDDRNITGVGFQPEYVLVRVSGVLAGQRAVARPASLSGDWSLNFGTVVNESNHIQAFLTDGFQVGTSGRVNTSGYTYHWVAFGRSALPTAVKLTSFTAKEYEGAVLLQWKTGYEVNNLGFHVYREENGERVRLTPEPVAGSALMAGSRTALTAGHHYHWWDVSALDTRPSSLATRHSPLATPKYWLKDIDLNGTHKMHGPVTPVISREPIPEKFRPELLSEVGLRLQERYHHYWKARELKEKLKHSVINRQWSMTNGQRAVRLRSGNKVPLRSGPTGLEGRGFHRKPDPAGIEVQRYLAGKSAVKIPVKEEGWYRVTQPELVTAGLSSKVNPHHLQLYADGREQPIRVIGGKDGRFGPRDAIEFYGVGLDTPSTETRVYWLVEGHKPGKRVYEFKGYSGSLGSLSLLSFPYTAEKKDRWIYLPAIKNGEEENFFGAVVSPSGADQLLTLRHLDPAPSEEALLEVILQGATEGPHRVGVLLNEVEVGEVIFEGQSKGLLQVEVPQAFLREGDNLVSFTPQGGEMDVSLVGSIRLTYWHTYRADDNGLRLTAQGGSHLTVNGFSHSKIRVIDVTDSNDVIEVIGKVESQKGGNAVSFRVPGTEQRTLLAIAEEKVKNPEGITPNQPSSWNQSKDGYDLLIITHRDFFDTLQPLKKLRESQGLKVALIDVEDLYDEFSFGNKRPKAIKDFLASAKTKWRRAPRFVLLVGDASFDPRNYLGMGDVDLVPTKLVDTVYMETASDDWFVDLNNDGLPEMAIGRLPLSTVEEVGTVVSKIVGYEKTRGRNEALLVADKAERSDDFNFEGASEEIGGLLPSSLMVRKIYRGQFSSDSQANGVLLSAINQGPLLVNFIGHGSIEIWRGILTSEDAEGLINGMQLPFFVNMTCLNGYFQDPYSETLGEALLKAKQGGAIAVWTSTGLTEPDKQAVMNKELIRLLFGRERLTIGEATARAKASVSDQDTRRTWILFGDPTTRLKQ